MRMWMARLFGTAASQMLLVAIGWHMYDLTASAWDLGLVGLYQFVPALVLALYAGHVVDRHHRGRIVAVCFAVQGLVALALLAAHVEGHDSRALLLGLSVVLGAVRAFQMPAQQALTPMLVPPVMLPRAMAFSSAGMQGAIIGGPALGGLLFAAGTGVVYGASVALFAVGGVLVAGLRYVQPARVREPVTLATVFAGVDFIWRRKPVLGAISLDLFAVLLGGAVALLPIYARDILHTGAWGMGLLRSAPAVGALVASIWLTRRPIERRVGRTLLIAVAAFGVCMVVFGLSRSFVVSLVALAVSGAADMVNVVIRQTLVQLETPDA
ncbi:MAG: MFS transporter, partial [Variovorax sp.]